MYTHKRVVILFGRKNAGVSYYQQYYTGKKYIDNKVRFFSDPCLKSQL
jgi:hypothetical protein